MLRSNDGLVRIEIGNKLQTPPGPSDFSIINLPANPDYGLMMIKNLYNTTSSRHVSLCLMRHQRRDRIKSLSYLSQITQIGFNYLDTVSIWYEKPSSCSNYGFLPVSEIGFIFYKGNTPDVKQTEWFGDGTSNATTLWAVTPQEDEGTNYTYYHKFCWEIPLLMMSLSRPLESRRFVYTLDISDSEVESLFKLCKKYCLSVTFWAPSEQMSIQWIHRYNELDKK